MLSDYIALLFFAVFALLVPVSLILLSKLIGKKAQGNIVKNAPYESAEATMGSSLDIENEYLPYFALFLPFEIITGILIVWSGVAYNLSYATDLGIIVLGLVSAVAAMAGYRIIGG